MVLTLLGVILWWAFSYPLAGWMGSYFPDRNFFYGGLISGRIANRYPFHFSP